MSGIFRSLQIGISALMTHQRAIDITGQNLANMNTPGYQRQRVDFRELSGPSGVKNPPILGGGVYANGINRYVTPLIDKQMRRQRGLQEQADETRKLLNDVESILREPSSMGIGAALDKFWQSWQDLTVAPAERAKRVALLQSGTELASTINETQGFIKNLQDNLDTQVESQIDRINDIAKEIADLNKQILQANAKASGPGGAIALEQTRDGLLFELSDYVDFTLSMDDSGLARVAIGNYALVDDGGPRPIEANEDNVPIWAPNGVDLRVRSGKMRGLLDMRDEKLPKLLDQIDELAMGLAGSVNELHFTGYGISGATGNDFFVGEDAATLAVNPDLLATPDDVATAKNPNSIGDISLALEIAELAATPTLGDPVPTLSVNGFYRSIITDIGLQTQHATATAESSQLVMDHLQDRRQAISGVSLDEEMANLLSFEKAFQAGARIINVVDEMLDQVINRMGAIGR